MRDVATLLEALPYIREFHGRTVVIKYGGAAMHDPALREEFARDVVLLKYVGLNPVVVHGGGPEVTRLMQRLHMPVEFVGGLRVSDAETVEVAKMVLVGKVNKDIVLRLGRHGQPAVGLCGDDGLLFRVGRQAAPGGEDIGFVGRIERIDVDVLKHVASDYIPVIASVGADREGNSYNINADEATVEVAKMVLVGKVNKDIVLRLNRHGQPAVGLCGDDGLLFRVATQTGPAGEDVGFVGRIERVNTDVIDHIAQDYIPVIASVGADRAGNSHNVNADEAAGAVARAMQAYKVMFLTDVPGWLSDPDDPSSVVSEATASEVVAALDGVAGGMRPKLQACVDALHGGVTFAHIVDGRLPHSLLLELFTDAGIGTKIRQ